MTVIVNRDRVGMRVQVIDLAEDMGQSIMVQMCIPICGFVLPMMGSLFCDLRQIFKVHEIFEEISAS